MRSGTELSQFLRIFIPTLAHELRKHTSDVKRDVRTLNFISDVTSGTVVLVDVYKM